MKGEQISCDNASKVNVFWVDEKGRRDELEDI